MAGVGQTPIVKKRTLAYTQPRRNLRMMPGQKIINNSHLINRPLPHKNE